MSAVGVNTGPKIAETPLELFEGSVETPILNKYYIPVCAGLVAFTGVCFGKFSVRRPVFSGIHLHIALTAAGVFIGKYLDDRRDEFFAERDAIIRHYIHLHPDDFPKFERKKFGEILEKWYPVR